MQQRGERPRLGAHGGALAVDLDEQMRVAFRQARRAEMLARGLEREAISHLQRGGKEAAAKHALDAGGGDARVAERGGEHRAGGRRGKEPQRDLGDEAEQALRADEDADEVEAAFIFHRAAAGADQRAVGERDLQAEHVVAGDAVLQAARAAGIGGDVAAERAFLEAGRVGRIKKSELERQGLEFTGDDARLHHGHTVRGRNFQHAIHAREGDDDAAPARHAAADVAATRSARGDGNLARVREFQQRRDLLRAAGKSNGLRERPGEPRIARVGLQEAASDAMTPRGKSAVRARIQGAGDFFM